MADTSDEYLNRLLRELQITLSEVRDAREGKRRGLRAVFRSTATHRNDLYLRVRALTTEIERYTRALMTGDTSFISYVQQADSAVPRPYESGPVVALQDANGFLATVGLTPEERFRRAASGDSEFNPDKGHDISVDIYLDTDEEEVATDIIALVAGLIDNMGYTESPEVHIERGSIFRRSRAGSQRMLSSGELRDRLVKVERAIEIAGIDVRQADVDSKTSEAVARLIVGLAQVPRACIRAGSILLIKYETSEGPAILARNLSQLEIRALERFPEIQKRPEAVFEALAMAVEQLENHVEDGASN